MPGEYAAANSVAFLRLRQRAALPRCCAVSDCATRIVIKPHGPLQRYCSPQRMVGAMKPIALYSSVLILASTAALSQTAAPPLTFIQPVPPAAVQAVQAHLHAAGAYSGAVDGVWGPDSEAALQRFQAARQLQATGQLNQATVSALGLDASALLGLQAVATSPLPSPNSLSSASVRQIQSRLHNLGFYSGTIDGTWGQSTQAAIQQFQQNRGLQPNGQLNQETVMAMGLRPDELAYR